jgi:hypothetical protein
MRVELQNVKALLLSSAAVLVAVAGSQAADMPTKAAVQYVKSCNLYGDAFYYLPGTNICVKIGGYVRFEYGYLGGSNLTSGLWQAGNFNGVTSAISNSGPIGYNDRWDGNDFVMRSRAYISMDTREQTEYGVLRTYLNIGINYDSPAAGSAAMFSGNRAFIQFAGFTIGLAQSFFDFYSIPATSYWGIFPASDTGDGGWKVAAFTASFGNGITSTLSFEDPRRIGIINTNSDANNPFTLFGTAVGQNGITTTAGADSAKERFPDIVYNWRIDQVWGSAQVMFAAHDASAAYYFSSTANGGVNCPATGFGTPGSIVGSVVCGHPADTLGWAAGAGFRIDVPNSNGSFFQFQSNYSKGALDYLNMKTAHFGQINGGTIGLGWLADGIVNNTTGTVDLTRAQGINAAYDHHWTPKFWTSVYGFYMRVQYDALANASICAVQNNGGGVGVPPTTAGGIVNVTNCSNDWSFWGVGSRWQYNLTPAMYVGFDILYTRLQTADAGGTAFLVTPASAAAQGNTNYQVTNQDIWSFRVRWHRDLRP